MITKEMAREIFHCYNEIEQAEKMIQVMKESINEKGDLELKDRWNESRDSLELHIPSGNSKGCFAIKRVSGEVALTVITAHIEQEKKNLEKLKTACKIMLA